MSKGKQTQSTQSAPWGPAQGYLTDGLKTVENLYNQGGMKVDYSGDWVADMTAGQNNALQGVIGQAGSNNSALAALIPSLAGIADGSTQANTWDTIASDTMRRVMPGINSSFAGSGMTGSTAHGDTLSRGLSEGLASAYTDYSNNAVNQQLSATSSLGGVLGQIMGNQQTALTAEGAYQTQNQAELDSQYQNGLMEQGADYEALTNYLSLITGIGSMGGTSTGTASQKAGVMGVLGSALGAASLFSDERLKTDIKRIGQTDSGLPIYTYRYIGGETVHMGVMAQEVAGVIPEAVSDMGGFLGVNYGAL